MTDIKGLLPKHEETFVIDLNNRSTLDAFARIAQQRLEIQEYFTAITLLPYKNDKITIPCQTCFLSLATRHEEIASLLREIAGEKVKPVK